MSFNDGSLEEKVPTRGPVKVASSRQKKKINKIKKNEDGGGTSSPTKKKLKNRITQSTPRAVPLAGTTRNVHLNIQDLLVGVAPKERASERRGIEKLVLR